MLCKCATGRFNLPWEVQVGPSDDDEEEDDGDKHSKYSLDPLQFIVYSKDR